MEKGFKRSFLGYRPNDVEELIHEKTKQFEEENNRLNKELSQLVEENSRLIEELKQIKSQISSYKILRKKLEQQLYNTHIEASTAVYEAEKRYEDMINKKISILQAQEKKNKEVQESINKLIKGVHLILGS